MESALTKQGSRKTQLSLQRLDPCKHNSFISHPKSSKKFKKIASKILKKRVFQVVGNYWQC